MLKKLQGGSNFSNKKPSSGNNSSEEEEKEKVRSPRRPKVRDDEKYKF